MTPPTTPTDDGADLFDDGPADEPFASYQPETTGDYRDASPEDPRGDAVYTRDDADAPLTAQLADIVTREGGRIPTDFSAMVDNEGYARARYWTVYAPAHNPYHVAAAVTDLLQERDGISSVNVTVSHTTPVEITQRLRASRFNYLFDQNEDSHIERAIRELRWTSGLPIDQAKTLDENPTEACQRIQDADFTDDFSDIENDIKTLGRHPGDAWNYHEVNIHIDEEADDTYYG